jgi:hypothetical protein
MISFERHYIFDAAKWVGSSRASELSLQLVDLFAFEAGRYVPFALRWDTSPERKCFQELRKGNDPTATLLDFDELTKLAAARRRGETQ